MAKRLRVCRWKVAFMTTIVCFAWGQSAKSASILSGPVVNPSNGHVYYLLTSDFWEPSEDAAVTLGGHLVTLNDQSENDWAFDTFSLFDGDSRTLWTGYHRLAPGGPFVWVSGEPTGFENWHPGEPNNSTGGENYAAFVPPAQDPGKRWFDMFASTTYFSGLIHGVVEVVPEVPIPGDGNLDGWVDGLDYLLWAGNFGDNPADDPPGAPGNGDYNDDGKVDGLDYLVWAGNFGSHAATSVPEPGALTMALLAFVGLLEIPRGRRA